MRATNKVEDCVLILKSLYKRSIRMFLEKHGITYDKNVNRNIQDGRLLKFRLNFMQTFHIPCMRKIPVNFVGKKVSYSNSIMDGLACFEIEEGGECLI